MLIGRLQASTPQGRAPMFEKSQLLQRNQCAERVCKTPDTEKALPRCESRQALIYSIIVD
jgi:hypothetical protein